MPPKMLLMSLCWTLTGACKSENIAYKVSILTRYRFCGQDEENDPSEEFEVYLACTVCGDNAHQQCARNADSLGTDDGKTFVYGNSSAANESQNHLNGAAPAALRKVLWKRLMENLKLVETDGGLPDLG